VAVLALVGGTNLQHFWHPALPQRNAAICQRDQQPGKRVGCPGDELECKS